MSKYIYLFLIGFSSFQLNAQQESQYTFFMFNQQLYNPAYVGSTGSPTFTALYRHQWAGFKGAPVSQLLSFQAPILGKRAGIGATISHYSLGISTNWLGELAYSYNIQILDNLGMRLGLQGTIEYLGIDINDPSVITSANDDPSIIGSEALNQYTANVGIGALFNYNDLIFFGASMPQIYPNDIGINQDVVESAKERPHAYAYLGAKIPASDDISFQPNLLVKYVNNAPLNVDMNVNLIFNQKLLTGFSYRSGGKEFGDSADLLLFYQLGHQLGAGMAYDFTLSEIKDFSAGSFEFILRYDLSSERKDLENPRYFN